MTEADRRRETSHDPDGPGHIESTTRASVATSQWVAKGGPHEALQECTRQLCRRPRSLADGLRVPLARDLPCARKSDSFDEHDDRPRQGETSGERQWRDQRAHPNTVWGRGTQPARRMTDEVLQLHTSPNTRPCCSGQFEDDFEQEIVFSSLRRTRSFGPGRVAAHDEWTMVPPTVMTWGVQRPGPETWPTWTDDGERGN
jgi:hypothetical protein